MAGDDNMIIVKDRCDRCANLVCRIYPPSEFVETEADGMPEKMICSFCAERGMVETFCVCGECRTLARHYAVELEGKVRSYDLDEGYLTLDDAEDRIVFGQQDREVLIEAGIRVGCTVALFCRLSDAADSWKLLEVVLLGYAGHEDEESAEVS